MVAGGGREVWTGKDLIITDPGAGSTKELPNPDGCVALDPSFSPDGNRIAFVAAKTWARMLGVLVHPANYEVFYLICLDAQHHVIFPALVREGTLDQAPVYPRIIVETALRHKAHSVILAH